MTNLNLTAHTPRQLAAALAGAALALGAGAVCAQEPSSLTWAVQSGLMQMGVTQPLSHVSTMLAPGLGPVPIGLEACMGSGFDDVDESSLALLCEGTGLRPEVIDVGSARWSRDAPREEILARVADSAEHSIVLVQGGWRLPIPAQMWGLVITNGERAGINATSQLGRVACVSAPRRVVILSPTNTSRTVRAQSEKVLETAARLLRGQSDYCAHALPGMCYGRAAVDHIANLAHRTPWCWQCDYASRVCLRGILQTWWLQLDDLAQYIRYVAEFEPRRRQALDRAAERVEATRDALLQWTDYNAIRAACADAEQQARYGEELRLVAPLMESAGRALADACELKKLDVLHANPVPPWPNAAWVLASRVPFYLEMPDSYDTFMCAVQVLARVVNTVETLTTLRAAAGNSFAILIDTNACALPPSITWDGGGATPLLEAIGCSAVTYICPTNTADAGVDFVRAAIAATIDKGVPVLAQNLEGYPGWSVILGYTNHARVLLARTPGDQARGLTACKGVPFRTMCVSLGRMPSRRSVLRNVLQRAIELYRTPATNGYACGRAAWEWYRDQVDLYGEMQVTPGPIVEAGSGRIWQWALKARRDAYDYLTAAMVDAPEVAIILGAARAAYVEEASALSLAMADGVVLGAGRRGSTSQWLVDGYLRQIDALNTAMALEAEAVGHLQNALLQLGTPSGLAP